ncbi:hypothetical protein FD754_005671, partial [Muntiacus muntjak]
MHAYLLSSSLCFRLTLLLLCIVPLPSNIFCLKVYFWHVIFLFYFSSPFTFSLSFVFIFHVAFCQQDITVLFRLTMCLLVREFSPLTFGMVTNMAVITRLSCYLYPVLLTELESPSWWPFSSKLWKAPPETKPKWDTSVANSKAFGKEGIVIQVPAVISQRTESHVKPGRLTVLVSGLEIYNSDSLLMHRFEREDVDDIKVHTPYEISIRQRFIGKPDITYHLISAKMPEVIPILEVQFSKKIELLEVAMMLRSTGTSSLAEKGSSVWHAASGLMDQAMHCESSAGSQEGRPLQLQTSEPVISEEDTQELGQ